MTKTQDTNTNASTPGPDDPRYGLTKVIDAVGNLIDATPDSALGSPTPCAEFSVQDLNDHLLMVVRRIAAIGRGEHWSTVSREYQDAGWAESYREAAEEATLAWTDAGLLGQIHEVPWGEMPGAPLMLAYTGEVAVHGWDLARATGAEFHLDDELLRGALECAKFIPAEGRDSEEIPFGAVVDPGADAPVLDQLAGWMGRKVNSSQ